MQSHQVSSVQKQTHRNTSKTKEKSHVGEVGEMGGGLLSQRQCHKQAIKRHKKLGWRNNNSATMRGARSSDYHVINVEAPC